MTLNLYLCEMNWVKYNKATWIGSIELDECPNKEDYLSFEGKTYLVIWREFDYRGHETYVRIGLVNDYSTIHTRGNRS